MLTRAGPYARLLLHVRSFRFVKVFPRLFKGLKLYSSPCKRMESLTLDYRRDESGNIAITFALSLTAIRLSVGVVIDYSQTTSAYDRLQSGIDSAAIAGAASFS